MAKYKGITGTKEGRIGNEIYYINKTQNLIRSAPARVYNPRSLKQMNTRIKVSNCNNGYRLLNQFKKLSYFSDIKEKESIQNAYIRHNFDSSLLVPRELSRKKGVPIFTLNNITSIGDFQPPITTNLQRTNIGLGVIVGEAVDYGEPQTIKSVSTALLQGYDEVKEGDYLMIDGYAISNLTFDNENGIVYNKFEDFRTFSFRYFFKIDTTDNTQLNNTRFRVEDIGQDTRNLIVVPNSQEFNRMSYADFNGISFFTYTFISKPLTNEQQLSNSRMTYNITYKRICDMLSTNKPYQEYIYKTWRTNLSYGIE